MKAICTFPFVFTCVIAIAQGPMLELWQSASAAYNEGSFEKAVDDYRELANQGLNTLELHFNLANAYYQAGDIPRSILHYERALRFRPYDRDVLNNLQIAQNQRLDPVLPVRQFFLVRWTRQASYALAPHTWVAIAIAWLWVTLGCLGWTIWYSRRKGMIWAIGLSTILTLTSSGLGVVRMQHFHSPHEAILMEDTATLHAAPDRESKSLLDIGGGEKLRIIDSLDEYYKVRLPNYEEGWIARSTVERI